MQLLVIFILTTLPINPTNLSDEEIEARIQQVWVLEEANPKIGGYWQMESDTLDLQNITFNKKGKAQNVLYLEESEDKLYIRNTQNLAYYLVENLTEEVLLIRLCMNFNSSEKIIEVGAFKYRPAQ
jgi:hypothetical protein